MTDLEFQSSTNLQEQDNQDTDDLMSKDYFSNIIEKLLFFINAGLIIFAYGFAMRSYQNLPTTIPIQFDPDTYQPTSFGGKGQIYDYGTNCIFTFISFYMVYLFVMFEECDPSNVKFLWKKMEWIRTSLACLSTIAEGSWIYMEIVSIKESSGQDVYSDGAKYLWIFNSLSSFFIGLLCLASVLFLKSMCSGSGQMLPQAQQYQNV